MGFAVKLWYCLKLVVSRLAFYGEVQHEKIAINCKWFLKVRTTMRQSIAKWLRQWWREVTTPTSRSDVARVVRLNSKLLRIVGVFVICLGVTLGLSASQGNWPLLIVGGIFFLGAGMCLRISDG